MKNFLYLPNNLSFIRWIKAAERYKLNCLQGNLTCLTDLKKREIGNQILIIVNKWINKSRKRFEQGHDHGATMVQEETH